MRRAYYDSSVPEFLQSPQEQVLGELTTHHGLELETRQKNAWLAQIANLQRVLLNESDGHIFFEFSVPRMGKRVDVVLLLGGVVFVLEYKVNENRYAAHAIDQVQDYALDLKNFHSGTHDLPVVPILVATEAPDEPVEVRWQNGLIAAPVRANRASLCKVLGAFRETSRIAIDVQDWVESAYKPTPTIIEAARALYEGHTVADISRSDAGAINLSRTADSISRLVDDAKKANTKTVCFVTGVPGSGKTLAGLNIATQRREYEDEHAVFLSGNGPLVTVLREALTRDEVARAKAEGIRLSKKTVARKTHAFIQNIHHFRDDNLTTHAAPIERVVVFDEAQRAWTRDHTSRFMRDKRQQADFDMSEPQFLLSVMDRHTDWCVVICLIGVGQEINTGEAGLAEWSKALGEHFQHWTVAYSDRLCEVEYGLEGDLRSTLRSVKTMPDPDLHLSVSVRSFRAESVSDFVAAVVAGDRDQARVQFEKLQRYPIVLTRDLNSARSWLREQARGSERIGLVASAKAHRLKPVGIYVKSKIDSATWFLNDKDDVRSSHALEDVATEFDIQGLELDWVGLCWDANFRYGDDGWSLHEFRGTRWTRVNDARKRVYLANAYRVLLTRARQGMVIFVPPGSPDDATRVPEFYDGTWHFLREGGLPVLDALPWRP